MKVYVVMGNDFPDAVFKTQEAAELYCESKRTRHEAHARRIYWRVYEFELQSANEKAVA